MSESERSAGEVLSEAGTSDINIAQAEDQFSKDADLFVSGVKDSAGLMFSSPEDMDADETERSVLQRVVKSAEFQYFILVCVLLGAVLAGLQTSRSLRHNIVLNAIDVLILLIFTIEAGMRMSAEWPEPQKYFKDGWNVFDFTIVVLGLLDLLIAATGIDLGGGANCIVVLRLFRLIRVLKMMRAFPQLQLLATTLLNSLPSAVYMSAPLLLVYYVFGCIGCFMFQHIDPRHFGNLGRAFVSLFRITTLDTWNYIMYIEMYGCKDYYRDEDKLVYGCDEAHAGHGRASCLYFMFFIVFGSFCLINLFIGVVMTQLQTSFDEVGEINVHLAEMDGKSSKNETSPDLRQRTIKQVVKSIKQKVDANRRRATLLKETLGAM